jgi:two-component system response regulator ResD
VAEDDTSIRELLVHHLEREGYAVLQALNGQLTLRQAREGIDLLILDIGMPGIDGLEVARTLRREQRTVPILMLTARSDEIDRIIGFEVGADDYVLKPFSPREVMARVKAVLRRAGSSFESAPRVLRFASLEVDEAAREARIDGLDIGLKPREFALLVTLASNPGIALSRATLLERVWGYDFDGDSRTVDVHVRRVRAKLEADQAIARMLQTVHGFGYKFAPAR